VNDPSNAHTNAEKPNHEQAIERPAVTITFTIPAYWTTEKAVAVVELLDELRDRIWAHYNVQLLAQCREQYDLTDADQSR
jgi:hypothetical protein